MYQPKASDYLHKHLRKKKVYSFLELFYTLLNKTPITDTGIGEKQGHGMGGFPELPVRKAGRRQ